MYNKQSQAIKTKLVGGEHIAFDLSPGSITNRPKLAQKVITIYSLFAIISIWLSIVNHA